MIIILGFYRKICQFFEAILAEKKNTANQLKILAMLFEKSQVSEVVARAAVSMLAIEVEQCQGKISKLAQDLEVTSRKI